MTHLGPSPEIACVCGKPLAVTGKDPFRWTLFGFSAEARTCEHCRSTRLWWRDFLQGRPVQLYPNVDDSEIAGEWPSILTAFDTVVGDDGEPLECFEPGAELRRNGVLLARLIDLPGERSGRIWFCYPPEDEAPFVATQ